MNFLQRHPILFLGIVLVVIFSCVLFRKYVFLKLPPKVQKIIAICTLILCCAAFVFTVFTLFA